MDFYGITLHTIGMFCLTAAVLYVVVFGFVMLDLQSGIRKAKAAGEYRSSRKLRDTVNKLAKYYNLVMMFTLLDVIFNFSLICLDFDLPRFPISTAIVAVGVAYIEIKSVYEKLEDKDRAKAQDAMKALLELSKNKDPKQIVEMLLEIEKEKKESQSA